MVVSAPDSEWHEHEQEHPHVLEDANGHERTHVHALAHASNVGSSHVASIKSGSRSVLFFSYQMFVERYSATGT